MPCAAEYAVPTAFMPGGGERAGQQFGERAVVVDDQDAGTARGAWSGDASDKGAPLVGARASPGPDGARVCGPCAPLRNSQTPA